MMRSLFHASLWSAAILVWAALHLQPVYAADDEDDELRAGVVATWNGNRGVNFRSVERTIAIAHSDVPWRRLGGAAFQIVWKGRLQSAEPGEYRLFAFAKGRVRITLKDNVLLDATASDSGWLEAKPIELEYDYHPLTVEFSAPPDEPRLSLFWAGPNFSLEPLPERRLFHLPSETVEDSFARGEELTRALRCGACHIIAGEPKPIAAPSLSHVRGQLNSSWVERWLGGNRNAAPNNDGISIRRMPHFDLSKDDARALAAYLERTSSNVDLTPPPIAAPPASSASASANASGKGKTVAKKDQTPSPERGHRLVLSLGCLACHQLDSVGAGGLYGGGDLSRIAEKRPAEFFAVWLSNPARLNNDHRMPVFDLSLQERNDLAAFLVTKQDVANSDTTKIDGSVEKTNQEPAKAIVGRGRKLFGELHCGACHSGPEEQRLSENKQRPLNASSNWARACVGETSRTSLQPSYSVTARDAQAIQKFISSLVAEVDSNKNEAKKINAVANGRTLLRENNCFACHARDGSPGLAPKLPTLMAAHPEFAAEIPTLTPPSLVSVGDKLHDSALIEMLNRKAAPHRPWLQVRMPKFSLSEEQRWALVQYFVLADRIPESRPASATVGKMSMAATIPQDFLHSTGGRLVTTDGFGCTSCHIVGKQIPPKAPPNARGPDLSMLGNRIRRDWFDRWVRNPARIIPGMEMPSVQIPVRGLLNDHLPTQLAAVWDVLNIPGFEPPEPNPIQVLRLSGIEGRPEPAEVVTDVLNFGEQRFIKPLLIGLPNRHSVLFDCETNRVVRWSFGDVARQRTKGKTWFWEVAGESLFTTSSTTSDLLLVRAGEAQSPITDGQFLTEPDSWQHISRGMEIQHRLRFAGSSANGAVTPATTVVVRQSWTALFADQKSDVALRSSGMRREIFASHVPGDAKLRLNLVPDVGDNASNNWTVSKDRRSISRQGKGALQISMVTDGVIIDSEFNVDLPPDTHSIAVEYRATLPRDEFHPPEAKPVEPIAIKQLAVAPGFQAVRLPLPEHQMPMAMSWTQSGRLFLASLKGRVWEVRDSDSDGFEDAMTPFTDELPAPYGLWASDDYVDVVAKFGVLRFRDKNGDGRAEMMQTVAAGWGHTADYHDWAVGLPRTANGEYFVALPCQQDKRSAAAARLRGEVLLLTPRQPTIDNPYLYSLKSYTAGHRFPMGLAMNREGALFATDNQGNFNPFNELNHVRPGDHFGFINANQRSQPAPTLTPAAVELPHPWTRSVNGICFLETPEKLRRAGQRSSAVAEYSAFGPYEGHMVGCEYDTRRLIRISLQKVGDTYQGCAYPMTQDSPSAEDSLLGPVSCAVSPSGELYVGSIRDSGWGGGNNVGELVRMRFEPEKMASGIVEVRATPTGFQITLHGKIDDQRASDPSNYSISSYRRVSTPAYGGTDQDRRVERIDAVTWNAEHRRVEIKLPELRTGFVYEFRLKKLVDGNQPFFPAEAYFTRHAGG